MKVDFNINRYTFRLFGSNIAVEKLDQTKTASGLYTPTVNEPFCRGKITDVGPDVTQVQADQIIHFDMFSSKKVSINGKEYLIIPESAVLLQEFTR